MTPHVRWIARLVGAALALTPISIAAADKPPASVSYIVTIQQMRFGATPATLRVGDSIEWVNDDIFLHSATARDGSFDVELKPKAHARTTFQRPGTYPFACRYHPGMTGTVVVR
jgi:plastocyanin